MEFDDLKNIWKDTYKNNAGQKLSDSEIERRLKLKSKSDSILEKIKRSYIFEIAVFVIIIPFLYKAFLEMTFSKANVSAVIIMTIFLTVIMQYLVRKYLDVRQIKLMEGNIVTNLKTVILSIENYIKFNISIFSKVIVFPGAFWLSLYIGLSIASGEDSIIKMISILGNKIYLIIALFIVVYILYLIFGNKTYKLLYERQLEELKSCLKEFEENDQE